MALLIATHGFYLIFRFPFSIFLLQLERRKKDLFADAGGTIESLILIFRSALAPTAGGKERATDWVVAYGPIFLLSAALALGIMRGANVASSSSYWVEDGMNVHSRHLPETQRIVFLSGIGGVYLSKLPERQFQFLPYDKGMILTASNNERSEAQGAILREWLRDFRPSF